MLELQLHPSVRRSAAPPKASSRFRLPKGAPSALLLSLQNLIGSEPWPSWRRHLLWLLAWLGASASQKPTLPPLRQQPARASSEDDWPCGNALAGRSNAGWGGTATPGCKCYFDGPAPAQSMISYYSVTFKTLLEFISNNRDEHLLVKAQGPMVPRRNLTSRRFVHDCETYNYSVTFKALLIKPIRRNLSTCRSRLRDQWPRGAP